MKEKAEGKSQKAEEREMTPSTVILKARERRKGAGAGHAGSRCGQD